VCKGPARNQIIYYEDPVVGLLPDEQRIASLRGGVAGLNAWSYQDEESAQGWAPTVVKGDGGGGVPLLRFCQVGDSLLVLRIYTA